MNLLSRVSISNVHLLIQFDFALMRLLFPQSQNNLKFFEQFLHSLLKRIKN